MHEMENIETTPLETLMKAYNIGKEAGLNFIYIGNISEGNYENTKCPKCEKVIIEREWRTGTLVNNIKEKKCPECGEEIAGFF